MSSSVHSYEQAALPAAQRWLTEVPLPFLRLCLGDEVQESTERILSQWRFKLDQALFEALGTLRIGELFDIIVDYPESMPAVCNHLTSSELCVFNPLQNGTSSPLSVEIAALGPSQLPGQHDFSHYSGCFIPCHFAAPLATPRRSDERHFVSIRVHDSGKLLPICIATSNACFPCLRIPTRSM